MARFAGTNLNDFVTSMTSGRGAPLGYNLIDLATDQDDEIPSLLGGDDIAFLFGGDDTLTGGRGADTFVLVGSAGRCLVTDFIPGVDILRIEQSPGEAADFAAFRAIAQQIGNDVFYDKDGDGQRAVLLQGVSLATMTAADFDVI